MDIDFNMNGAEAVAAKANNLAKSMGKLESAWSKYNRAVTKGSIGGGFLRGVGKGGSGGSAVGGLVGGAVAFITVQKIMEKLMGDKVKEWTAALVKEDLKRWGNIGKGLVNFVKPIKKFINPLLKNLSENFKLLRYGAGQMFGGAWKGAKDILSQANIPLLLGLKGKLPKPVRALGYFAKTLTKMISGVMKRVPISAMIATPILAAMLDERISKWLDEKLQWVVNGVVKGISATFGFIGDLWGGFKMGLARATNNAYYSSSQVNRTQALQQLTPEQQTAYIASETKRLESEDLEEFVRRTRKELTELFEAENKKRNEQIVGIQEIMIYQGRL